jgi:MoxR-vWA-beta-propeller ternary system domain bpX2
LTITGIRNMIAPFADVCCASLPGDHLGALAELRAAPGVLVLVEEHRIWVRWERGDERVLRVLMPIPGAILYAWRDGVWRRAGARLPAFDVPAGSDYRLLHHILFPAPVQPLPPPAEESPPWQRQSLRLVPDAAGRATTGLLAPIAELLAWLDTVPSARFRDLQAALCEKQMFVLGSRLPLLRDGQRFWGKRALRPLGYRLEPDLPESAIRDALGATSEELLIFHEDGSAEMVPTSALGPLTRAGVRRAVEEASA